jgi:hypothetical protein
LREKDVETVMPGVDSEIMVLKGEFKGEIGKLISRNKKRDKCEIQLLELSEAIGNMS